MQAEGEEQKSCPTWRFGFGREGRVGGGPSVPGWWGFCYLRAARRGRVCGTRAVVSPVAGRDLLQRTLLGAFSVSRPTRPARLSAWMCRAIPPSTLTQSP